MQFLVIAHDQPGALPRRMAARAEHLAGIRRGKLDGWVIDGGALLDDAGAMAGSVMLLEFPDRAALDACLAAEPYQAQGVWGDVTVTAMRRVDWTALLA